MRASSWSAFGAIQSAAASSGASRSKSRAAGMQHVDGDERAALPGGLHDLREPVFDDGAQGVGGADEQGPAAADPVQVDVGQLEERCRAWDVQGGTLPVGPDRQDRRRRLGLAP
ncbi:MAG: hypothetical protein ACRDOA_03650 [Streptosporangiaceae bacterium]